MAQAGGDVAPSWANRRIWGDVGRLGMREKPADCSREIQTLHGIVSYIHPSICS